MAKKNFTLARAVTTRGGVSYPMGVACTVEYDGTSRAKVMVSGGGFLVSDIERLPGLLVGYPKIPSIARLDRMGCDGVCTTPTGFRVEPDGVGPDNSPSWFLALGMI